MKILEYFTAARGARKALPIRRFVTDSVTLRRLVDVPRMLLSVRNCGDKRGLWVSKIAEYQGNKEAVIEKFEERLVGRYTVDDIINPYPVK